MIQELSLKKIILMLSGIILALFLLVPAISVSAQNTAKLCDGADLTFNAAAGDCGGADGATETSLTNLVNDIINIFSIIVGIVAVIMIIYGGFRFITSGGDSAKVASARNTIVYAIVGLIIVAFAQFIVKFVLTRLTKES